MGIHTAGWKRAAIYDPSAKTTVAFNILIAEGSEYPNERISTESTDGRVFGGFQKSIRLGFIDDAGLDQIRSWSEQRTPVRCVIEGRSFNIICNQDSQVYLLQGIQPNARDGAMVHVAEIEERIGDDLAYHELVNIAEGDFLAPEIMEIVFPVAGVTWSVGADYDAADTDELDLIFLDSTGSPLASHSASIVNGRVEQTQAAPAGTYTVRVDFGAAAAAGITNRTIRTGTNASYVAN